MKIHHLDCGTLHPRAALHLGIPPLACHCLLIETEYQGLVLVDTGFGIEDCKHPFRRLGLPLPAVCGGPDLAQTAFRQIEALGLSPADVEHIIPTHLDLDHAGGLADFPNAQVHIHEPEFGAALHPRSRRDDLRYRQAHFAHGPRWVHYQFQKDRWFDLPCIGGLAGLPEQIRLISLPGHTAGHCGVAIETDSGWLLHAGDSYIHHRQRHPGRSRAPVRLRMFQWLIADDRAKMSRSQQQIKALPEEVRVFCTHDRVEFESFRESEPVAG